MEYRYIAIQVKQTSEDKYLTLFSAPSAEINTWSGVPQKRKLDKDAETVGFQREENPKRIDSLRDFYLNDSNIIQNPLLCSLRDVEMSHIEFHSDSDTGADTRVGTLSINIPDFDELSLQQIMGMVRNYIEERVPELKDMEVSENVMGKMRQRAADSGHLENDEDKYENNETEEENILDSEAMSALFEETHIFDFWEELAARCELSNEIDLPEALDEFLGFERDALLAYLKPIVLVDGQHRLRGAIVAAMTKMEEPTIRSEIEERVALEEDPDAITSDIILREGRNLPVSLLMSSDPAEQVFQFVVVNQKATPIGRALLGTIVSTTLSSEEMSSVADRLKRAGIQVEESQAITHLARNPDSPFYGLIERGLTGDATDLLQWNVFGSLINIFRDLRGGKIFGERVDWADNWRRRCLDGSALVENYEENDCDNTYDYWRKLDGPWRSVFIEFWRVIKEKFASTEDAEKRNYWGRPRTSNLFNKISLNILASDFFQFIADRRVSLDSVEQIEEVVDDWLREVSSGYFDRDWQLAGVKKDATGIRNQWAKIWVDYRMAGGSLPNRGLYKRVRSE